MALRTLVTGRDMCSGSDGAGPSNAVGALVNQLLGAGKTQEQLRDVRGGGRGGGRPSLPADCRILLGPGMACSASQLITPLLPNGLSCQLPVHHAPPPLQQVPLTAEAAAAAAAARPSGIHIPGLGPMGAVSTPTLAYFGAHAPVRVNLYGSHPGG